MENHHIRILLSCNSRNCRKKEITEIIILEEGDLELQLPKDRKVSLKRAGQSSMAICVSLTKVWRRGRKNRLQKAQEVLITLTGTAGMNLSKADRGHSS